MSDWQHNLIDGESLFLRAVNEGYRTWCLRYQKIMLLQKQLDSCYHDDSRLEMRVQQLKAMTLGQPPDPRDETVQVVQKCEESLASLEPFISPALSSAKKTDEVKAIATEQAAVGDEPLAAEACSQCMTSEQQEMHDATLSRCVDSYRQQMHALDLQIDAIFENKYEAELELKEFEQTILEQWRVKKQASEYWTKRHAALTGMRSALRAGLQRHERRTKGTDGAANEDEVTALRTICEERARLLGGLELRPSDRTAGQALHGEDNLDQDEEYSEDDFPGAGPRPDNDIPALSDVLAEGGADTKEREEILKREHAGSAEHPHGCRPCHFQGGLCWKGLACSFCHICPKPKRKSKHQRDVDKRRQERYKQVKDDLGISCLDELTKIDDSRRLIMTSSEELKKRVKDAYASCQAEDIVGAREMVTQMKNTVDSYHSSMPFLLSSLENENESNMLAFEDDVSGSSDESEDARTAITNRWEAPADDPELEEKQEKSDKPTKGAGPAPPINFSTQKRAAKNKGLRQEHAKGKSKGFRQEQDSKGKVAGGSNWMAYGNGWSPHAPDPYGWGKKGPPPMDMYWYGKGLSGPYPPENMYYQQPLTEWWSSNSTGDMWSGQVVQPPYIDYSEAPEDQKWEAPEGGLAEQLMQ